MNIKKEDLEFTLEKNKVEKEKQSKILQDLEQMLEELKNEKGESKKYVFVGGRTKPNDEFKENQVFLFKIEETEQSDSVQPKLDKVMQAYNASKKGRRIPAETYAELIYNCPKKYFREEGLKIATFEPIEFFDL